MVRQISAILLSFVALGACGDDGGGTVADADAAVPQPDAEPQNFCTLIEPSFPDLGSVTGTAELRPTDEDVPAGPQVISLQIPLNAESPPDVLFIEIWEDTPPFDAGAAPYTVNLIADHADLLLCGACTFIAPDFTDPNMIDFNMAYSGELVLSALDSTPGTGRVTGTLSNVKLHEVTIDEDGQEVVTNGCRSTIEAVAFDFDVAAAP